MYIHRSPESRDARTSRRRATGAESHARGDEQGILGLQQTAGNAAVAAMFQPVAVQRSKLHSDKDLFGKMQAFRDKNSHLTEAEQNKIFWSIKKATGSDEVAYTFFDYYSGSWGGKKIRTMTPQEEAGVRKDLLAVTDPGGDTKVRSGVLAWPDETLGPILLHEFAHTGGHTNTLGVYDFEEGQAYGIEYFYAERTGGAERMTKIISILEQAVIVQQNQRLPLKETFRITYALMHALDDLTKAGSSPLPPLAGKNGEDGRVMAAKFVSSFSDLPKDVQALWDHIRVNLASFKVPDVL
jgi:hypothetical protein